MNIISIAYGIIMLIGTVYLIICKLKQKRVSQINISIFYYLTGFMGIYLAIFIPDFYSCLIILVSLGIFNLIELITYNNFKVELKKILILLDIICLIILLGKCIFL